MSMVCGVSYSQFRDSLSVIIQTPSGNKIKLSNLAIGDTTFRTAGGIGYNNNAVYFYNGTVWSSMGSGGGGRGGSPFIWEYTATGTIIPSLSGTLDSLWEESARGTIIPKL